MALVKTSMAFETMKGSMGQAVLFHGRSGLVFRRKPRYRRPTSPDQLLVTERLQQASASWRALGADQIDAWQAYARTIELRNATTGQSYSPIAFNAFIGLATKILQIDPLAELPEWPPAGPYLGDTVPIAVSPAPGAIVFTASAANVPGTVTELLVQKLESIGRTPGKRYKSMAFVQFAEGELTFEIQLEPGVYACAYRFTEAATGRTDVLHTMRKVVVP